jgi:hypothetical protein
LYLFKFYKIAKIGGTNNPYASIECPGIQIPRATLSLLEGEGIRFTFFNGKIEAVPSTRGT